MTDEQFDNLVHRREESASRDPAGYRRRVVALAFLGYAYLGFVLAVLGVLFLLALASLTVLKAFGIELVVALGAFIALVLRAMWVRLAPPPGREAQQTILASVHFPGEAMVISVEGRNYRFGRKFRFMRGARVL